MENREFKLVGPFRQLVSMSKMPLKGPLADSDLVILEEAGILIHGDKILKTGLFKELLTETQGTNATIYEMEGDFVALPGWIDCHTHICFAGSREKDYALRNSGKSYLEIAKSGGGIWDTVSQTRKASLQELRDLTLKRAEKHFREGVTTLEIKSGYGLSVQEELKMLRAIKAANSFSSPEMISTCLAAHICPKDFEGNPSAYLKEISENLFPILKNENLSNRMDAFVEEGAFSVQEIIPYFKKAKSEGFQLTVHADQFHTGGSQLAVNLNALSADHLEASTDKEISLLAKSKVIATALPGATLGLGCAFTPARKLLDAGAALAIASDWNPGSAPMGDLLLQASLLGTFQKLSNAEVLAGITFRAAAALGLNDRGQLISGSLADFILFETKNYQEILYYQGKLKPAQIWKKGILKHQISNS